VRWRELGSPRKTTRLEEAGGTSGGAGTAGGRQLGEHALRVARCGRTPVGKKAGPGPVGAQGWLGAVDEVGGRGGEDGPMFFFFPQIGSI
jgi:hypothetical protein